MQLRVDLVVQDGDAQRVEVGAQLVFLAGHGQQAVVAPVAAPVDQLDGGFGVGLTFNLVHGHEAFAFGQTAAADLGER